MVIFSSSFLYQIIKQLFSENNLEEKTVSLNGYCNYAVLHMHTKKLPAVNFILSYICKCCSQGEHLECRILSACWLFVGTKSFVVKKTFDKKNVVKNFF